MDQKRQHTDRMRNLLKKKEKDSSQTTSVTQPIGSAQHNQSSTAIGKKSNNLSSSKATSVSNMVSSSKILAVKAQQNCKERFNLEYIDWKESYYYRQ